MHALRLTLISTLLLLSSWVRADITVIELPSQNLYARFDNAGSSAFNLTAGSGLQANRYFLANAGITGVAAGTYTVSICVGTAVGQSINDEVIAVISDFVWNGSAEVVQSASVATVLSKTPDNKPTVDVTGNVQSDLRKVNSYATIDGYTIAQLLAFIASNAAGNITDSDTTPRLRSLDNDLNRITATVDEDGNRTNTLNVTDLP